MIITFDNYMEITEIVNLVAVMSLGYNNSITAMVICIYYIEEKIHM